MKTYNKSPQTRKKTIVLIVIIALALSIGVFFIVRALTTADEQKSKSGGIDYNNPTQDQQENGTTIKGNSINSEPSKPAPSGSDQPPAPISSPGSSKKIVEVTVSASNQNGNIFQIRSFISAVVDSGTCTLVLKKVDQATITQTAGIQPSATTSSCKGFDIPVDGLSKGNWQATISFENNELTGSAAKTITIQ